MYDSLRKYISRTLFTLIALLAMPVTSQAIDGSTLKNRQLKAFLVNGATGVAIPDTIYAEVLTPDSVSIIGFNITPETVTLESNGEITGTKTLMILEFKNSGDEFLLKLSHPDYADAWFPVQAKGSVTDLGTLKMRRLTSFERSRMLSEVVVKASVIQVVNKGDTIQYNADAFAVAKGSMLDALIEKMPGVELRDGGQIYVNGRFVDKLLLDGKDFFQGDQFVLLQNLPAYSVKNLKVYEQASASHEVFGRKSSGDPDLFVMDITLKKGFNSGFMANAEAGGGSHSRYRGRAFGAMYNTLFRLGAFGYINNLNESRNPGRNGNWDPAETKSGLTTSKGGGVSYGYFAPNRRSEFTGTTSAQYIKTARNSLSNIQNFLSTGDTYTRSWNDNLNRNVSVKTDNTLTLRPKEGNKYNQMLLLQGSYNEGKTKDNTTEGTFGRQIGAAPDLRRYLEKSWVDGMGGINRYLAASEVNTRKYNAFLMSLTRLSIGADGLSIIGVASYDHSDSRDPNFNNYMLQYAGQSSVTRLRSNPVKSHGYNYNFALEWFHPLGLNFDMRPRIDYYNTYEYDSNPWFAATDSADSKGDMLPSMQAETLMRLDPRNSYIAGQRYTNLRLWLPVSYKKTNYRNSQPYSEILAFVDLKANIRRNAMDFDGRILTSVEKKYVSPSIRVGSTFKFYRMLHQIQLNYSYEGSEIDPFDLLEDVVFDSDPLNHRTGNPDLKQTMTHLVNIFYYNTNWMFDRLKMYVDLQYINYRNQRAMSYAYDRTTGVRTYRPVNVNGNWYGEFVVGPTIALTRDKNLKLVDYLKFQPRRSVDMMSTDGLASTQKSVVNSLYISEYLSVEYNVKKFMAAFDGQIETRRTSSREDFFNPFRITTYRYGVRGRVSLPAGFEVSTDLKMYSTRGFDYHEMNTNQLVWNARITKPFMGDKLMLILDGYDILGKVKNISYNVNEQGRTETWVNNIPSYVMLSLRWNFAKKPKE